MFARIPRPSAPMVVAVAALVVASAGGAVAAIPDADGTIHTCRTEGTLRVIDSATETCRPSETPLDFNQRGRPGPPGPAGPVGRPGPDLAAEQTALGEAADGPPPRVLVKKPRAPKLSLRQRSRSIRRSRWRPSPSTKAKEAVK